MKLDAPDARCGIKKLWVHEKLGPMQACYCINCGVRGGSVTEGVEQIVYLCEACAIKHGDLPLPKLTQYELDSLGIK